jgi:hypothetical protein
MEDVTEVKNKYANLLKCTFIRHRMSLLDKVQQDFFSNSKLNQNFET